LRCPYSLSQGNLPPYQHLGVWENCSRWTAVTAVFQRAVGVDEKCLTERARHPVDGCRGAVATGTGGSPKQLVVNSLSINLILPADLLQIYFNVFKFHPENAGLCISMSGYWTSYAGRTVDNVPVRMRAEVWSC
jgi:hypothetical protein